ALRRSRSTRVSVRFGGGSPPVWLASAAEKSAASSAADNDVPARIEPRDSRSSAISGIAATGSSGTTSCGRDWFVRPEATIAAIRPPNARPVQSTAIRGMARSIPKLLSANLPNASESHRADLSGLKIERHVERVGIVEEELEILLLAVGRDRLDLQDVVGLIDELPIVLILIRSAVRFAHQLQFAIVGERHLHLHRLDD